MPRTLLSVGVVADDDPDEARRQAASSAMAMLRMFQRRPFLLLPPDEVAAHASTGQERHMVDTYTRQFLNGTPSHVAARLEQLHTVTGVDEVMLVPMGHSRRAQTRTVELMADHYALPTSTG